MPEARDHPRDPRDQGPRVSSQGPPIMDPRAIYEKQIQVDGRRSTGQDPASLAPPRGGPSRETQRMLDQHHDKQKFMRAYSQMSDVDQKAYLASLKDTTGGSTPGRTPDHRQDHMSAANLIDLIITHQINRSGPNNTHGGGPQTPNPRRSPQTSDGKESPSKPPSHSPSVKSMPDTLEIGGPSGSGVRTSPGTMGEHIENMISKEVGRANTGSPYPGSSSAEQHEHWKRRGYVVQDGYRPPSQPRPPSNSHPGLRPEDERVIQRVVQNASPGGSSRPDKPPSRSMHEAISPPTSSPYPPHTMYSGGQTPIEPTVAKFLAAKRRDLAESAAAVSRAGTGVAEFDNYVKYKITEVMKNEKGAGGAGPSEAKPPTSHNSMGPPHKRPLESEARGSPSDHAPAPESPNKRYKRDEGQQGAANDMPDSPESGDMVIDESARPDSAHSHKTNSPAPQLPTDPQHYPPGYRGPGGAPPRSSPAPSGTRPPPQPSGAALARYEPLSDDD